MINSYPTKYRFIGLTFLLLMLQQVTAQECNFPLPPSNTCGNAPLLCNLDGYCSDNAGATNSGTPNAFCGQVENNNWISFIAGTTTLQIKASVFDCNNGEGLQMQVFQTDDCNDFIAKSNCLDPIANGGSGVMTAVDLEIGQIYYLMMDGKGGDVCHYSYELLEGSTLSPASVEIQPPGYLCTGSSLTLEATSWSSNPGLVQQWVTLDGQIVSGENSLMPTINKGGTYFLGVVDASGCTDSTFILVEETAPPIADAGIADTLNCLNNTSINLDGSSTGGIGVISFQWSTVVGNIVSNEDTATPNVNAPGLYFLAITDEESLCTALDTVNVPIDANTPFAIVGGGSELNCVTTEITLNGAGSSFGNNFTYLWTTADGHILSGNQGLFPVIDKEGTYELQVNNLINGCIATNTVAITFNGAHPTGADISTFAPCFEKTNGRINVNSVLGGTPPYLYSYGNAILTYKNEAEFLTAGEYAITIKDDIGCAWDTIVKVDAASELLANLGEDFYLLLGCDYELTPLINIDTSQIGSINWLPKALFTCDTCFSQILHQRETTQTYHFNYTDKNGCFASDAITIYLDRTRNIFIPNIFSPNNDGVNDIFYINGGKDVAQVLTFRVFDRWGSLLHEASDFDANDPTFGWDGTFQGRTVTGNVFTYMAEIEFLDGWREMFTGSVVLMR